MITLAAFEAIPEGEASNTVVGLVDGDTGSDSLTHSLPDGKAPEELLLHEDNIKSARDLQSDLSPSTPIRRNMSSRRQGGGSGWLAGAYSAGLARDLMRCSATRLR